MEVKNIDLAPEIAKRTRLSRADKQEVRSHNFEMWTSHGGLYQDFYTDHNSFGEPLPEGKLTETEKIIAAKSIKLAQESTDRPAIVVDFGGMYSLSFFRIAGSPKVRELVTSGKLMFVVTNIEFNLEMGEKAIKEKYSDLDQNEIDVINKNRDLVTFVQSDAAELKTLKIRNRFNGQEVPLQGNIDLIHEQSALMHGIKNDVDLYLLSRSLSDKGILLLGSKRLHPRLPSDPASRLPIEQAHLMGIENLKRSGLLEYHPKRHSFYRIFSKPGVRVGL